MRQAWKYQDHLGQRKGPSGGLIALGYLVLVALALQTPAGAAPQQSADYPPMRATAYQPPINFSGLQADLAGDPTQVLVLGSHHLAALPEGAISTEDLEPLLDRLAHFSPDIVAIEAIDAQGCDQLRTYRELYAGAADRYCWDTTDELSGTGSSPKVAILQAEQLLADWPQQPSPADRRRLAATLYAAGERWSAALQFSYLAESERQPDNYLSESMIVGLDRALGSRNENNLLGVALARRLGLQRLSAMDDHSADLVQHRFSESVEPALLKAWRDAAAKLPPVVNAADEMDSPEGVLRSYRLINSEAYLRSAIARDFGAAASASTNDNAARQYLAWWQVRGLRMAANVMEAAANRPGARVVVIVGSSHKPYFEAYLDQMQDVELIDAMQILQ